MNAYNIGIMGSKNMKESRFNEYLRAEEKVLTAKLEAIRLTVPPVNRAEKGRSVEIEVMNLLRDMLPSEYGLSTGFIAFHANDCVVPVDIGKNVTGYKYDYTKDEIRLSSQIDVIIYDALRFGPLSRVGSCDVFPLEAVYAYVEIKSWIDNRKDDRGLTTLEKIMQQSFSLRSQKVKLYRVSIPGTYTKVALIPHPPSEVIPMRSYVFILDTADDLDEPDEMNDILQSAARDHRGHISGMYVQGKGFFRSQHGERGADIRPGSFDPVVNANRAFARFRAELYSGLSRYPRPQAGWTPAIDRYYENVPVDSATSWAVQAETAEETRIPIPVSGEIVE